MSDEPIDAEVIAKSTAMVRQADWGGAAARGLEARQEREKIVRSVLKDGPDFGKIPGTTKATLLKPGAEKIADSLNLYPDYEVISCTEEFGDKPLFFYRYRCVLRSRGTDSAVATGIGSCNSMEARYRWRNAERVCPHCKKACIIKGKKEYDRTGGDGGWLCFKKKGGCGASFGDDDQAIVKQEVGRVENDDVASMANTVDKMAQKRAMVAAALNLGFSDHFTQDLEDSGGHAEPEHPDRAAEQEAKQPLIATWQLLLDPETVNLAKLNGELIPMFKAVPGQEPGRAAVWAMMLAFAKQFNCYFHHGSKQFVENKEVKDE